MFDLTHEIYQDAEKAREHLEGNRRSALKIPDAERAEDLLRQARHKRLTYRWIGEAGHA
ncbi:hypothetical protein [Allorhizobium terrae]|uniref:hypothetical protein n=1 Tax=Allorhizobium terrae TaxID=1848972 RepID=UPI0038B337D4